MVDLSLVGRCGLYCGACGIYRAYKDDGRYLQEVAESFDCSPELVRCEGCQNLTMNCWGHDCRIVSCLKERGFLFCYECGEIDECGQYSSLQEGYKEIGVDLRQNLQRIESGDAKGWVEEENKRWRCGACQMPISYHMEECHHCGSKL